MPVGALLEMIHRWFVKTSGFKLIPRPTAAPTDNMNLVLLFTAWLHRRLSLDSVNSAHTYIQLFKGHGLVR